jgi:hypothetical protein
MLPPLALMHARFTALGPQPMVAVASVMEAKKTALENMATQSTS